LEPFKGNFEKVAENACNTWNKLLSRIEVFTQNETDKGKFYTSLYRTYNGKSVVSDVNGKYTDGCGNTQTIQAPADVVYSADGLWGGQWNLSPLWAITAPEYLNSYINSMLELQRVGGWIPEAPVALEYAPIMGAQHHNALIISAYQKGIHRFDAEKAYAAIKHDYTTQGINHPCGGYAGNRHLESYLHYGYVPDEVGPTSNTVEYAYDDWCMGQFAKALGKKSDYIYFNKRSENFKNNFDTTTYFIRRRHADGSWVTPFDPYKTGTEGSGWNGSGYMESNAFVYSFFVPHNITEIEKLTGSNLFSSRLEEGLENDLFDLSNQPSLEVPFIFNYIGKPWLTQKFARKYTENIIDLSPYNGWYGEEDEGQLSAMYVLASIGLFETDGGCAVKPIYEIASPVFDKIVIHLDSTFYKGSTFIIETHNNSNQNIYIQSATFNGKPLNQPWFYHSDFAKGGKLYIEMGSSPNKNWGNTPIKQ
jgi:predicted alpha-1,2-mannosidase